MTDLLCNPIVPPAQSIIESSNDSPRRLPRALGQSSDQKCKISLCIAGWKKTIDEGQPVLTVRVAHAVCRPSVTARANFASELQVTYTRVPRAKHSFNARGATPPPTAVMRTMCPRVTRALTTAALFFFVISTMPRDMMRGRTYLQAVTPATGQAAACTSLRCAGVRMTCSHGTMR